MLRARAGSQETLPAATEATTAAPGKGQWRQRNQVELSSLDALDLPMEIEGVFIFAAKRHKKHKSVFCERESKA
ncbi:MAG: hypothetical protein V7638_5431 [Acidobacteriota bacterium]|jgi:hypothetical protein